MRQWMVDPKVLCRNHLLGEHRECHTFRGTLKAGISIEGYLNGLFDPSRLKVRHDELVVEMERRGYSHYSPIDQPDNVVTACVNSEANLKDLAQRCIECCNLQKQGGY